MKKLSSVELKNFMSHEHTVMKFDKSFTVLSGDNGSGKTVVFRALDAILFGGSFTERMIRRGTKESSIKVVFDDGSEIEAQCTKKGRVTILTEDGKSTEYKGIADIKDVVAKFTGFSKVYLDKNSKTPTQLQYIRVKDGRFLVDSSAEVVMRIISAAFPGAGVEQAKTKLASQLRKLNSEAETYSKELAVKDVAIAKLEALSPEVDRLRFAYVARQEELKVYLKEVEKYENAKASIARLNEIEEEWETISDIGTYLSEFDETVQELKGAKEELGNLKDYLENRKMLVIAAEKEMKAKQEFEKECMCAKCGRCVVEV